MSFILDEKKVRTFSRVGSRATFGLVALELAETVDNLVIVTGDVSTSAGLERFKKKFPSKYIDVGIAEQNMIGVAAGLASEGYNVVTTTFAPFQTLRCCEQIKVNLGYMRHNVCLVGLASGVVLAKLGYTHCSIEDLSVMRSIPGMTVLSPSDCGSTAKCIAAGVESPTPTYIRLTGASGADIVHANEFEFNIGKSIEVKPGKEIAIVATGTMVGVSLEAARLLDAELGVSVSVFDMHSIKPIDEALIDRLSSTSDLVVSVEEHSVVGGLGSAISEVKTRLFQAPPHLIIGLPDAYPHGGSYEQLLHGSGLTVDGIFSKVAEHFMNKRPF